MQADAAVLIARLVFARKRYASLSVNFGAAASARGSERA